MSSLDNDLLRVTLALLIERWGVVRVRRELDDLGESPQVQELRTADKRPRKQSAVELAEKLEIEDAPRKELIRDIASRMDAKEFIRSPADAREFLIMNGARPPSFKDRSSAHRMVLLTLSKMPTDELRRTRNMAAHGGPARMRDISEAISDVAGRRPGPSKKRL